MSWFSMAHTMARPLPLTLRLPAHLMCTPARHVSTGAGATTAVGGSVAHTGLGAARAGTSWDWATHAQAGDLHRGAPAAAPTPAAAPISIPAGVLREMREAARASGRSESVVWAEAAREWLRRRQHDDGPLPPAPPAALPVPRRARSWETIDAVLADLRQRERSTIAGEPAA